MGAARPAALGPGRGDETIATRLPLPRRDLWVVVLVTLAIGALIVGFAVSAPGFRKWDDRVAMTGSEPDPVSASDDMTSSFR